MLIALLAGMAMTEQGQTTKIEKWMPTRWTAEAEAGRAWTEYPRPQLVRDRWLNLNGWWDCNINNNKTKQMRGPYEIRVPYPIQSHLSGLQEQVTTDETLFCSKTFQLPKEWAGQRIRLNFGAVDWKTVVTVNSQRVGEHIGGYDPFSFDITDFVRPGSNTVIVEITDPTNEGDQPHGKQTFKPEGIWYTAVTGIWQTVWLEPVPASSISSVFTETKINGEVTVNSQVSNPSGLTLHVRATLRGTEVATASGPAGSPVKVKINKPQLWSPDSPTLYDLEIELRKGSQVIDTVQSYTGIREISLKKDKHGVRTYLNGEPIFMFGPLDQGWWPDGLYTPPTDDALRYDLEVLKRAGFNTVRKHVKVEPARFYRHCDELGLLVWQDMPSNLMYYPGWNTNPKVVNTKPDGPRPEDSKRRFEAEWQHIMDACRPFPSVVVWVPFNEAWGQFDTKRISEWTKQLDPTRLVNSASGGNFVKTGDILDIHVYPGPGAPDPEPDRAIVLGEFGGLGLPWEGHTWQQKDNWGYRSFTNPQDLMARYEQLIKGLVLLKSTGLSAAIYTQTTDVEIEVNGLMTYDRAIAKMPIDWLRKVNLLAYGPPVTMKAVLPTADETPADWAYTFTEPAANWFQESFAASGWKTGKAGFGTEGTPGAVIGTVWSGERIWIRREFNVTDPSGDLWLKIHHDEDATVYLNGKEVAKLEGYTGSYTFADIPDGLVRKGKNTIAVSCKQTRGGQYIDAGIYRSIPGK